MVILAFMVFVAGSGYRRDADNFRRLARVREAEQDPTRAPRSS